MLFASSLKRSLVEVLVELEAIEILLSRIPIDVYLSLW
jgi:hypothetical protein